MLTTCILQILECVAVNLTLIYALLAYSAIKQKDFSTVYVSELLCMHMDDYSNCCHRYYCF